MDKDNLRLNAEKKIDSENFKVKIGTVNRLNPRSIYIEGRGFITPTEDKDDYSPDISIMKHSLKKSLVNELNKSKVFDNKFIFDFDIASNCMKFNKSSFLSFQITLRQKGDVSLDIKKIKEVSSHMVTSIVDQLVTTLKSSNYLINKSKS